MHKTSNLNQGHRIGQPAASLTHTMHLSCMTYTSISNDVRQRNLPTIDCIFSCAFQTRISAKRLASGIDQPVTYRKILVFWLPLALAWLLMTLESAWIQAVIGRKPDSETQLAAFGLMFSLSILIETPIIMLLATSNALSRDRQSFRLLWRFMMWANLLVTALAVLMAFTPLLDLYLGTVLNIPIHIIEATRPGMKIMILWGGFIGYRRFHQGIIIRFGNTRYIGYGTVLRVVVSGGVAIGLGAITNMAGAVIGALGLVLAVVAESVFTYFVSRPDVKRLAKRLHSKKGSEPSPSVMPCVSICPWRRPASSRFWSAPSSNADSPACPMRRKALPPGPWYSPSC